ncbi:hypothetical protein [Burkholderia territorii]|uniref:hypothetical protein n=1 Tax=Burkholderia territorii TaxID=1503055 RepID=UPI000A4B44A4|nr:hypothetical protein [Burkholderia territorii]
MKIKCVKLLDVFGREIEFSPWLTLERIYHVMIVDIDCNGKRSYGIVTSEKEGEWPNMGMHQAECFEIVSTVIPSNWRLQIGQNGSIGIAPGAWQMPGFFESFYDHDPDAYPVFERERSIIINEDL